MATVNQRLLDQKIAHALSVLRYGNGLAKDVVSTLNDADADIRDTLAKRLAAIEERGLDMGPVTTKRLAAMSDEIGEINSSVYGKAQDKLFSSLSDFGLSEGDWNAKSLTSSVTLDWEAKLPAPELLRSIAQTQPMEGALLKDTFATMSGNRADRITQAIRSGMVQGQGTDQIVQKIIGTKAAGYADGVLDISRRSADAITRTAVNHVANVAAQSTWAANNDVVKAWQFVATLDSRTTITCAGLNGQTFPIGQGPMPPRHIRCRSITVAVTKSFKELGLDRDELAAGTRASMDGQIAGDTTFADWLNAKGEGVQNKILGPTRAQLFRDGKLDLQQFIKGDGTVLTLNELKALHPEAFEADAAGAAKTAPKADPVPEPTPAPEPEAVAKDYSPINPHVSEETIAVEPKKAAQADLSESLAQAAQDSRYETIPEYKGIKAEMFAKADLAAFTDPAASAIKAIMPELDDLADTFEVPRIRAIRSQKMSSIANIGDGVLGVNPAYFNAYADAIGSDAGGALAKLTSKLDGYKSEMDDLSAKLTQMKADFEAAKADGETDRYFEIYAEQGPLVKRFRDISKKHFDLRRKISKAQNATKADVSIWKPGDDPAKRPFNAVEYFDNGVDKMRSVMYHEFGHQVHQMLGKVGRRARVGIPPFEQRLKALFNNKFFRLGDGLEAKRLQASTYATTNPYEWWAENFSLYMMGRKDLVDGDLIKVIEELLHGK